MLTLRIFLALVATCLAPAVPAAHLQPYRDEAELSTALERWRGAAQRLQGPRSRLQGSPAPLATMAQESSSGMAASWPAMGKVVAS